ncbi:MAG: prepilin-type N-terminal cleavage/methylation domain-containing protein [Firmicutes bacterium]|nr:prepilin-type N-terminal cleavage/methylation domain-containing protein [Bacillota bacterium]
MTKKNNVNRGFTLAELLIVVAIIAVLVAVAIPIFSGKLKESRLAVDHANIRSAYAYIQVANITETVVIDGVEKSFDEVADGNYYVSKDLSSLVTFEGGHLDSCYKFKETGVDETGLCKICQTWDTDNSEAWMNLSGCHYKDSPLTVNFDGNLFSLGFKA